MSIECAQLEPILDVAGTLARFGGDQNLFIEMAGILLEDAPRVLADLDLAVASHHVTSVRGCAHALKGLLAGCGGVRAAHRAQLLENAGNDGDLSHADVYLAALHDEFNKLCCALTEYRAAAI